MVNDKNKILIEHKNNNIEVLIVYRKRKNITIQVKPKDKVSIISPPNISKKILNETISNNIEWIVNKIEKYKDVEEFSDIKELKTGSILYYLGQEYKLEIIKSLMNTSYNQEVVLKENTLTIYTKSQDEEFIRQKLKSWYKNQSEKIVKQRLSKLKQNSIVMFELAPNKLKIKEQKKRWGSCTSEKSIYINSKISMLRPSSIDYILVHEFCHLVHMNHSKDFYNLVKEIMPTYKSEVDWLKNNNYKFML